MASTKTYNKNTLPPIESFSEFRKVSITLATRVSGPFEVDTLEGMMRCNDGWLALDSDRNPYPIAHHVFIAMYSPAHPEGHAA